MRYEILHNTHYEYETPVSYLIQLLRLTPRSGAGQNVINWSIGAPTRLQPQVDVFGNHTHVMTITQPITALDVNVRGVVEVNEDASGHRFSGMDGISPYIFTQATPLLRQTLSSLILPNNTSAARKFLKLKPCA